MTSRPISEPLFSYGSFSGLVIIAISAGSGALAAVALSNPISAIGGAIFGGSLLTSGSALAFFATKYVQDNEWIRVAIAVRIAVAAFLFLIPPIASIPIEDYIIVLPMGVQIVVPIALLAYAIISNEIGLIALVALAAIAAAWHIVGLAGFHMTFKSVAVLSLTTAAIIVVAYGVILSVATCYEQRKSQRLRSAEGLS